MNTNLPYQELNRESWNARTDVHFSSEFYNVPGFLGGASSLNDIELGLLGDLKGKKILHLQCHFGQDTLSLARMGGIVTGTDLSDRAIGRAEELALAAGLSARFVCCDLYELPGHLDDTFDIVFTSYGVIGWLPDLDRWAAVISRFLKPGGRFVMAEFHPVVWMFDDNFEEIAYSYFNTGPIIEEQSGTYTDREAPIGGKMVTWNHGIGEVLGSLLRNGIRLRAFSEFDYSPYDCFRNTIQPEPGRYRIRNLGDRIPMVYALAAEKSEAG